MRLFQLEPARPQWYDRNPLAKSLAFAGSAIAPHGNTVRWTYTVPANRKCLLEWNYNFILRETAAGVLGAEVIQINYTPSGGGGALLQDTRQVNNSANALTQITTTPQLSLFAGDNVNGDTTDTSTGGTSTYALMAKGTEFDA